MHMMSWQPHWCFKAKKTAANLLVYKTTPLGVQFFNAKTFLSTVTENLIIAAGHLCAHALWTY